MTESDLAEIEEQLGLQLPKFFRRVIAERLDELKRVEWCTGDGSFYLDPRHLIAVNQGQRPRDSATSGAFPGWDRRFFMIGTNGGGDFYCLRRDGKPGVWMIGSDCGNKPERIAKTFERYINELLEEWDEELARRAAIERRRVIHATETEAHLEAIARDNGPARAQDWATEIHMYPFMRMLDEVWHKPSPRKLRLYGLACCARIPGLTDDEEIRGAIEVAQRMTQDHVTWEEIDQTRDVIFQRLQRVRDRQRKLGEERFLHQHWMTRAVLNLFQSDEDYLAQADIYPDDAVLLDVYSAVNYALGSGPYGSDVDAHLLREVLGNPLHPAEVAEQWRTATVLQLARTIFDEEAFERMAELASALEEAGCNDERILAHCRKECPHVRGCWVIDEILELDPKPAEGDFSWDYSLEHPTIDTTALKERLGRFGFDADSGDGKIDDLAALEFADWLEANDDPQWAAYIRARCRLDERIPGDDYADALEEWIEASDSMHDLEEQFDGFFLSSMTQANPEWWSFNYAPWIRGLPTVVDAISPLGGPRPIELVARQWDLLVARTPVRGIDFAGHYQEGLDRFLASAQTGSVRWLSVENRFDEDQPSPIDAIIHSQHASSLKRLEIGYGMREEDVEKLASSELSNLTELRLPVIHGVGAPLEQLMHANWFRNLELLELNLWENGYPNALTALTGMARLHSLTLFRPDSAQIQSLSDPCELPSLRRLQVCGEWQRLPIECLSRIRASLVELALSACRPDREGLSTLLANPLCAALHVLHFDEQIDDGMFDVVATSAFASDLRALRVKSGTTNLNGLSSLERSPLTQGAFPNLTTLELKNPLQQTAKPNTPAFLAALATPNLRHLNLDDCATNDKSARILGTHETFANLRRLTIGDWGKPKLGMSRKAAERLAESPNLKNAFVDVSFL